MKAVTLALLHIFLPMWIVVILHSKWLSPLNLLWISVCIGAVLYGIRLLLSMPLEDIQVPFMESCNVRVWPHCIFPLVVVSVAIIIRLWCFPITLLPPSTTCKAISGWGLLGMLFLHGNFGHFVILMIYLLFGEVLIRSVMWYTGKIPNFLMNGYDLHEPLASGLPPGSDLNTGSYNPPI